MAKQEKGTQLKGVELKSKLGDLLRESDLPESLLGILFKFLSNWIASRKGNKEAGVRARVSVGQLKKELAEMKNQTKADV